MASEEKNAKKAVNSFSLLQQKMNEVQKSKKPTPAPSSKSDQSSSSSKPQSDSPKITYVKKPKLPQRDKEPVPAKKKVNLDPNVPDRSFGDYFCPICDSHMNSDAMWEAHITGKRHIKNIKKGDTDSKYEDLDVDSNVKYEIRNTKDPVVGLSYIHEIRRKEAGAPPLYTCFLCQATFATVQLVIEHVLTMKHRMNYMKENSPHDFDLLEATNLKKGQLEPLVEEVAAKLEQQDGRGSVKVKKEINKAISYGPPKRVYDSEDDDLPPRKFKNQKLDDDFHGNSNHSLKSNEYAKRDNRDSFRDSRDDFRDTRDSFRDTRDTFRDTRDNFRDSVKDCRDILNEKRRHAYSPEHDYRPSTSGNANYEPLGRTGTHFSRSPIRDFPMDRYSRSRSPPRESYGMRTPYSVINEPPALSRSSYPVPESARSSETYPPSSDARVPVEKSDSTSVLKDFVEKIYALPAEIFLKIVLLKLDSIDIKGISELQMLSKIITKAKEVVYAKLPQDVQAAIKQGSEQRAPTASNVQMSSSVLPQMAGPSMLSSQTSLNPSSSLTPPQDFNFIKDFLSKARADASAPVNQNVASFPSNMSLQGSSSFGNYNSSYQNDNTPPYNSAPSSSSGAIPGLTLTEENRDAAKPSFSAYQSQYTNQPSTFAKLTANFPRPGYDNTSTMSNPSAAYNNPSTNTSNPPSTYNNPLPNISNPLTVYSNQNLRYINPSSHYSKR